MAQAESVLPNDKNNNEYSSHSYQPKRKESTLTSDEEAEYDDLLWDQLCVNPHQESLSKGIHEGHEAGHASGFKEGEALGQSKALEIGIEIGFYEGCAIYVIHHYLPTLLRNYRQERDLVHGDDDDAWCTEETLSEGVKSLWTEEKIQKTINKWNVLLTAIKSFPRPDDIFHHGLEHEKIDSENIIQSERNEHEYYHKKEGNNQQEMKIAEADITGSLQRIRSKFKVLTIQLKIPKFSLRGVLDQVGINEYHSNERRKSSGSELEAVVQVVTDSTEEEEGRAEIIEHDW